MIQLRILQALVSKVLPGWTIVAPAYEQVEEVEELGGRLGLACGTGPERVYAMAYANPSWHRNRASNEIALAEWLEKHGK